MKKLYNFDEVHDCQKVFRVLLKAISNPLQKFTIKPFANKLFSDNKAFLAIAFTVLDNETSFYTFENQLLDNNIMALTLAEKQNCSQADFIFVENQENLKMAIDNARIGTLLDPHKSATIFVKIKDIAEINLNMQGPGINKTISLKTDKIVEDALDIRDKNYFEYPQGIDLFFIDENDNLFAIPRLVKREVL